MFLRANQRDRWLLSYADFVTLLFATFVLMYATAKAREHGTLSHLPGTPTASAPAIQTPSGTGGAPLQSNLLTDLQDVLKVEQKAGVVTLSTEQRGIIISLDDKLCFLPGQADVQSSAIAMFEKVGTVVERYDNRILLEGHTDSVPIHNNQFRSNWELSTARSIAVMELMEKKAALRPERFLIGGSADNAPVSSNETEQGRAHNRRVEIVVLDSPATAAAMVNAAHPMAVATP
ncbi:MAG: OmpA family protein [Acidobacteriota bacterium]|nr:OmpA family protein [Acidobacteriota bacterium]